MSALKTLCFLALSLPVAIPAAQAYDFTRDGVYYNISADRKKAIVTYSSLDANAYKGDIVIPATVEYGMTQLKVREIGDHAFFNCPDLKSVRISEGIITIGQQAFSHCSSLSELQLPSSMYSIGDYAFEYCEGIESVSIPASTEMIGYAVFQMCTRLGKVDVAESNIAYCSDNGTLYSAGKKKLICFPALSGTTELDIPEQTAEIEDAAFTPAYRLEKVNIGASVSDVIATTFSSCPLLSEITVDPANESLASADGVLFDKKMQRLIQFPVNSANTIYEIPEGVSLIEDMAMAGSLVSDIVLPSSLRRIGTYAFYRCNSLTSIISKASVPPTVSDSDTDFMPADVYAHTPLTVPTGSETAYRAAKGWRNFKDISDGIKGIESIESTSHDNDTHTDVFDLDGRRVYSGPLSGIKVNRHGVYVVSTGKGIFKTTL